MASRVAIFAALALAGCATRPVVSVIHPGPPAPSITQPPPAPAPAIVTVPQPPPKEPVVSDVHVGDIVRLGFWFCSVRTPAQAEAINRVLRERGSTLSCPNLNGDFD